MGALDEGVQQWRASLARGRVIDAADLRLILVVALGAAMGSTCAEGHMSCRLDLVASQPQVVEELAELLAYVALCCLQGVVLAHRAPCLPARSPHPVKGRAEEVR